MCIALLASASAFVAPPAPLRPRGMTAESPLALRRDRPLHVGPQMVLGETGPLPLLAVELFGSEYPDPLVAVGAVAALAAFAWSLRTSFAGGAAIILLLLGGDPEERVASGANENEILKQIATLITPSAWKKSYLGDNAVEGEEPQLLDLPAWQGQEARELVEPEAVVNVQSMQLAPVEVPSVGPVQTCFMSLKPAEPAADAPPVLLIHGFDSSLLEFRYIAPTLVEAGLRVGRPVEESYSPKGGGPPWPRPELATPTRWAWPVSWAPRSRQRSAGAATVP